MTRALLVLGSLPCVFFLSFQNVSFPWCGHLLFSHDLSPWCPHSALNLSAEGAEVLPSSPTFGPGRQELDKIVFFNLIGRSMINLCPLISIGTCMHKPHRPRFSLKASWTSVILSHRGWRSTRLLLYRIWYIPYIGRYFRDVFFFSFFLPSGRQTRGNPCCGSSGNPGFRGG